MLLILFLILGILVMFYLCTLKKISSNGNFSPPIRSKNKDYTECFASELENDYESVYPVKSGYSNIFYRRKNKKRKQKRKD